MHAAVASVGALPKTLPFGDLQRDRSAPDAAPLGSVRVLAKDEEIFAEGDRAAFFYKVISGAVRTSKLLSDGRRQIDAFHLGRVDGFGEDEHEAESDEGSVVPGGFLATESNALEALELSDALLDAGASAVERFREESWPVLGVRLRWNDGADAAGSGGLAVGLAA